MHCNSERKIRETLSCLAQDPAYQDNFLELYPGEPKPTMAALSQVWPRFVELSGLDPYTPERLKLSRQYRSEAWCRSWVDTALRVCRLRDSEFSLALQESMEERFELAAAMLAQEGRLPFPRLDE